MTLLFGNYSASPCIQACYRPRPFPLGTPVVDVDLGLSLVPAMTAFFILTGRAEALPRLSRRVERDACTEQDNYNEQRR
jgi:hypothetical protein